MIRIKKKLVYLCSLTSPVSNSMLSFNTEEKDWGKIINGKDARLPVIGLLIGWQMSFFEIPSVYHDDPPNKGKG